MSEGEADAMAALNTVREEAAATETPEAAAVATATAVPTIAAIALSSLMENPAVPSDLTEATAAPTAEAAAAGAGAAAEPAMIAPSDLTARYSTPKSAAETAEAAAQVHTQSIFLELCIFLCSLFSDPCPPLLCEDTGRH
jgi:hypothetical protein